jgi:hypothetical protein
MAQNVPITYPHVMPQMSISAVATNCSPAFCGVAAMSPYL